MTKKSSKSTAPKAPVNMQQPLKLDILSWNVNDLADRIFGTKSSDPDFVKIITNNDIFCLQETKRELKIPEFRCYNSLRSDSRSGGLCIGIRQSLANYFKILDTKKFSMDFQAARVSRKLTGLNQDTIIINVYDSPENSSYKMKAKNKGDFVETLSKLDEFIASLSPATNLLLLGDFNARTGSENTMSRNESETLDRLNNGSFATDSSAPSSPRVSTDPVTNLRGRKLLDFGTEWNLTLLNGSIIGDARGSWTCQRYNGLSVIDYVLISHQLKSKMRSLEVLDFTEFSDHKPLKCSMDCPRAMSLSDVVLLESFEDQPLGFKWQANENESKKSFMKMLSTEHINSLLSNIVNTNCNNQSDVYSLNKSLVDIIIQTANGALERKKIPKSTRNNKNAWFNIDCRKSKRNLNKLAKAFNADPENEPVRKQYYETRKAHRKLCKQRKTEHFAELNRQIADNKNIKWDSFKNLKQHHKEKCSFDLYDLGSFYRFFKELYSETSLSAEKIQHLKDDVSSQQATSIIDDLDETLNGSISATELDNVIARLKRGKAVAEDCIANEFLINSTAALRSAILKLFNSCLTTGTYPWNVSVVTPLHKKGDKYDPDNYRAIAVGSNLGKLFSSILLDRLTLYRNLHCPDPINQLGFCKEAQTADHTFTLNTCLQKYLGQKKRVYSCFIDYRKTFDTVCREALLYKLFNLGIKGQYFKCLQHMYSSSKAKIKLLSKMSESIDVLSGTEQGHPMSPELFKCYLLDMSKDLDDTYVTALPELNGISLSHLLWADDLVLLALDTFSLQQLINTVHRYCEMWGLSVNISKTAVLVFNKSGRVLNESRGFMYGSIRIPSSKTYCYLGITFTLSGSLNVSQDELRKKGLRAYFSLKNMLDIKNLSVSSLFKLFDALIIPVISYGCQVWICDTQLFKLISSGQLKSKGNDSLKKIASDAVEKLQLKLIKWTLGLQKRAANLPCWGDSGRFPVVIKLLKQSFNYYQRLEKLNSTNSPRLVRHAFAEQRKLGLPWFSTWQSFIGNLSLNDDQHSALHITESSKRAFEELWLTSARASSKLQFYTTVKQSIGFEPYLSVPVFKHRKALAKLRSSNHKFNRETGRYMKNRTAMDDQQGTWSKSCKICSEEDAQFLCHLPFFEALLEDEHHILVSCPLYHHIRVALDDCTKSTIVAWDPEHLWTLFSSSCVGNFARYVHKIFATRFPEKTSV